MSATAVSLRSPSAPSQQIPRRSYSLMRLFEDAVNFPNPRRGTSWSQFAFKAECDVKGST